MDGSQFSANSKAGATAARDYLAELRNNSVLNCTFFSYTIEMHPGIDTGRTGHYRLGTESLVCDEAGRSVLPGADLTVAVLDKAEQ